GGGEGGGGEGGGREVGGKAAHPRGRGAHGGYGGTGDEPTPPIARQRRAGSSGAEPPLAQEGAGGVRCARNDGHASILWPPGGGCRCLCREHLTRERSGEHRFGPVPLGRDHEQGLPVRTPE